MVKFYTQLMTVVRAIKPKVALAVLLKQCSYVVLVMFVSMSVFGGNHKIDNSNVEFKLGGPRGNLLLVSTGGEEYYNKLICYSAKGNVSISVAGPTITLGSNPIVCKGTTSTSLSYTVNSGSPNQYSIDYNSAAQTAGFTDVNDATLTVGIINLVVPAVVSAGTYSGKIIFKDAGGSESPAYTFSIQVDAPADADITRDPNVICDKNGNEVISPSDPGSGTGVWSIVLKDVGDNVVLNPQNNSSEIKVSGVGIGKTAVLAWTVTNACGTSTDTVKVSRGKPAAPANINGPSHVCEGTTQVYTVVNDPGVVYTWDLPSGASIIAGATTNSITVNYGPAAVSGLITVTASNVCGSSLSTSFPITVNPLPTATVSGSTSVCRNAAAPNITFTGAGGTAPYTFTYNINGGTNLSVTTSSGDTVTVATPTGTVGSFVYNLVSVKDASSTSCSQTQTGSATVIVKLNPVPKASITKIKDATCSTGTNGAATLLITGGTNPAVTWKKDGVVIATPDLLNLSAGIYEITVADTCATIVSSITISSLNRVPIARNDMFSVNYGTTINNTVAPNDDDPDGDALMFSKLPSTNTGVFKLQLNGSFTYTPAAGFSGTEVYTYTVTDSCGATATATVTFNVAPLANTPPTTTVITVNTWENVSVIVDVLSNVKDKDNNVDPNTLVISQNPTNGTVLIGSDFHVTYTPNPGFYGQDRMQYTVCDASGACVSEYIIFDVARIKTDLVVNKVSIGNNFSKDEEFEYRITAENRGVNDGTGIKVTDMLPSELIFVDAVTSQGTYMFNPADNTFIWDIGNLRVGEKLTIILRVKSTVGGSVENTATITGNQYDPDLSNNTSTDRRLIFGFHIPNVFTPDGDGTNDYFVIERLTEYESEICIYNRWGDEVYKSKNYGCDWNGSGLPQATYYYILKVKEKDSGGKWISYTGHITIIR